MSLLFSGQLPLFIFIQNAIALATHNLAIMYLAYLVPSKLMKINLISSDRTVPLVGTLAPTRALLAMALEPRGLSWLGPFSALLNFGYGLLFPFLGPLHQNSNRNKVLRGWNLLNNLPEQCNFSLFYQLSLAYPWSFGGINPQENLNYIWSYYHCGLVACDCPLSSYILAPLNGFHLKNLNLLIFPVFPNGMSRRWTLTSCQN